MRRVILAGSFLILLAILFVLWQNRFERTLGHPVLTLADLRVLAQPTPGVEWLGSDEAPRLRLRVDAAHPTVVTRMELPEIGAVDFLHLRFQMTARNLTPGKELWDDGRCMIEWHAPSGGSTWENDPFGSVRYDDSGKATECVMRPENSPSIPALRIEHLGVSGDLEISQFEATVIRNRMVWKISRCFLIVALIAWLMAWIGFRGRDQAIRAWLAACVWTVMAIYFVVPGPWKLTHSFGAPFNLGEVVASPVKSNSLYDIKLATSEETKVESPVLKSVGKIPDKGDFALRVKHLVEKARPLLHAFLLFGPALVIACLVGRRSALSLMILMALCIEAAQVAFGYGFDRVDVLDLGYDGIGIAAALVVHHFLKRLAPRLIAS